MTRSVVAVELGSLAREALSAGAGRVLGVFTDALGLLDDRGDVLWLDRRPDALSRRGVTLAAWDGDGLASGERWESDGSHLRLPGLGVDLARARLVSISLPARGHPRAVLVDLATARLSARPDSPEVAYVRSAETRFLSDLRRGLAFAEAARPLIGLGPGLTPAGDDFLGGFLLARRMLGKIVDGFEIPAGLTSVFGAARLLDHAAGEPSRAEARLLHALVPSDGSGDEELLEALDALSRLGHSSGWDFAAGVVAGLR